jgi:uncharacterized protein YcbX
MAGEQLQTAVLTPAGIQGDRELQVRNSAGRMVTSRTHPALLGHRATFNEAGEVLVDDRPWNDPGVLADVQKIAGSGARLVRDQGLRRFDILPLLVLTDGTIAAFGRDHRRLRPNLVIGGVPGLEERTWEGRQLSVGDALIQMEDLRGRCVMTTYDPDTLVQDPEVLRDIMRRFGGRMALNTDVIRGGTLEINQEVRLLPEHAR